MFKKLQTGLESAAAKGNQMINNMRGIETTLDETFEIERRKFDNYQKCVENMANHLKAQLVGLGGLNDGLKKYAADMILYSGDDRRVATADDLQKSIDSFAAQVENHSVVSKQCETNLRSLFDNLTLVKKEVNERDRLLGDFDKARFDYSNETKKQPPSAQLPIIQQRVDSTRIMYEKRNEEVLRQISETNRTRNIHADYQALMSSLASLMSTGGQLFGQLSQQIHSVGAPIIQPGPIYAPQTAPVAAAAQPPPVARRAPPPPQAGPAQVKALFAFKPEAPTELPFNVGDIITIVNDSHPEWWIGSLNGRSGEFPSNYVQRI